MPISVVVADNQRLILRGLVSLFEPEQDIALVGRATTGDAAMELIKQLRPDVAVLDLQIPRRGALDIVKALHAAGSATRCVILAGQVTEEEFMQAMRLGVKGVILKDMPSSLLVRCVRMVHAGEEFLEKETYLRAFRKLLQQSGEGQKLRRPLTERERAAVELAVRGLNNKEVARSLGITDGTVKAHLHRAYAKLRVKGRMGLAQYARETGMV